MTTPVPLSASFNIGPDFSCLLINNLGQNFFWLGPIGNPVKLSPFGRTISFGYEDGLSRKERAASGLLREDRIAIKKFGTITYETIDESEMDMIDGLYELGQVLELKYRKGSKLQTLNVLLSPPPERDRLLAVHGGLWTGYTIGWRQV
jgi:hypothetical protein